MQICGSIILSFAFVFGETLCSNFRLCGRNFARGALLYVFWL
jgi:hypothetical protein